MTILDIPEIVGNTVPKAITPTNIQAEFRVAGLPINRDVFENCDFMPAEARDCSKPVRNTTLETDHSVHDAKHEVLLVVQLMYALHRSMRPFTNAESRMKKCDSNAAQTY